MSEPHSLASLSKTFCLYFTLLGDNKQGKDKEVLKKQIHLLVFENQPQCVKDKKMTRCRFVPVCVTFEVTWHPHFGELPSVL